MIIGHSCGSSDLSYHAAMLDRGCILGFDRFGLDFLHPDKLRLAALIGLLASATRINSCSRTTPSRAGSGAGST